jgi:hypothetical protein
VIPLLLILLATAAAAVLAYGTHPALAESARGLGTIMLTRRLEWPLITFALLLCVALLGLVIANRRRAWWLIGLAPVLALFVHRFSPLHGEKLYMLDEPAFVASTEQNFVADDAWVVGILFEDQAYALPLAALYRTPVVFITDYDKRMVLFWSPRANRAVPMQITREFKARDLEFVSTPADTILLFDRRLGQFIVALTGKTPQGEKPSGLGAAVPVVTTPYGLWRNVHPQTKVLQAYEAPDAPSGPVLPSDAGMLISGAPAETRIALLGTDPPVAVVADKVGADPQNITAGETRVLLLRDPHTHRIRAFDRRVEDLFPSFRLATKLSVPEASLADSDSNSLWNLSGKALTGDLKDKQLREITVEDNLYWGPMKTWYPKLVLLQ